MYRRILVFSGLNLKQLLRKGRGIASAASLVVHKTTKLGGFCGQQEELALPGMARSARFISGIRATEKLQGART